MTYKENQTTHQSILELQDKVNPQAVTIEKLQNKLADIDILAEGIAELTFILKMEEQNNE